MQLSSRRFIHARPLTALAVVLMASGCGQEEPAAARASSGARTASRSGALVASEVLPSGPVCTPTGAHAKHAGVQGGCKTCHACGGVLQFDPAGPAVGAGKPLPTFDATAKTCSNVACHAVAGTFTYEVYNWASDTYDLVSFPYGGSGGVGASPAWYSTSASTGSCGACHGMPPTYSTWHSGQHGYQYMYATTNACQTCHPDVSGLLVYSGGTLTVTGLQLTNAAQHGNGSLDVTPRWNNQCFGCH
jgi:predicted CxxxxCH...CXXCH cytochrome family protein